MRWLVEDIKFKVQAELVNDVKTNLNEAEITEPKGLEAFAKEGGCSITVSAVGGYDQMPQSASIQIVNTKTFDIMAGINWQNGWGGQQGSIADRVMRKGLTRSAKEIVNALDASYQGGASKLLNVITK